MAGRAQIVTDAAAAGVAGGPMPAAPDVRGTRGDASLISNSISWSSLSPSAARFALVAKHLLAPSINVWSRRRSREHAIWLSCLSLPITDLLLAAADKLTTQGK